MLDNQTQHSFDKSFVNASWKDLKQILDEDMPVTKSPNNHIIIILSILLFLSLSSIGYLLFEQTQEIPLTELIKEKIIYKEVIVEKVIEKPVDKLMNYGNLNHQYSTTYNTSNAKSPLDNKVLTNHQDLINIEPMSTIVKNNENSILSIKEVAQLNSTKVALIASDNHFIPNSSVTETFTPKLNDEILKVNYSLGLLTFISNNLDYSGYGFSSGIQIPLSKKFGLQTGFSINFVSRDFLFFPFFEQSNVNQSAGTADLNKERTYYDGLESFKQIFLPLNLNYNINKMLSFNSGLKFRYTYSKNINTLLKSRASKTLSKSKTVESTFFNHTNIGLTAGFTYKVNDKLNFIFDSEWGVRSLIKKNEFSNPSTINYDLNLINLTTNITF